MHIIFELTSLVSSIFTPVFLLFFNKWNRKKQNELARLERIKKEEHDELIRKVLRIEIMTLIYNSPNETQAIFEAYDEYKKLKGNHYMSNLINNYLERINHEQNDY